MRYWCLCDIIYSQITPVSSLKTNFLLSGRLCAKDRQGKFFLWTFRLISKHTFTNQISFSEDSRSSAAIFVAGWGQILGFLHWPCRESDILIVTQCRVQLCSWGFLLTPPFQKKENQIHVILYYYDIKLSKQKTNKFRKTAKQNGKIVAGLAYRDIK